MKHIPHQNILGSRFDHRYSRVTLTTKQCTFGDQTKADERWDVWEEGGGRDGKEQTKLKRGTDMYSTSLTHSLNMLCICKLFY